MTQLTQDLARGAGPAASYPVPTGTPAVEARAFSHGATVVVVNTDARFAQIRLDLSASRPSRASGAAVRWQNRRVAIGARGVLADTVAPMSVSVYDLAPPPPPPPDASNQALNPSFETGTVLGVPDAYQFYFPCGVGRTRMIGNRSQTVSPFCPSAAATTAEASSQRGFGASARLDPTEARTGRVSLRLHTARDGYGLVVSPPVEISRNNTFSDQAALHWHSCGPDPHSC